ncbi:MAG: ArsR family transcriptional regulator [Candidatus Aenigmatarchaeota archaeon]
MRIPKILTNEKAIKILNFISKVPSTANEIAKALNMHEQLVYYYLKKLREENLIDVFREEKVRGFSEKYYYPTKINIFKYFSEDKSKYGNLEKFFSEFFSGKIFNGYIVVGSPLPHGPFLTSARDLHYASQLSFLLGKFGDVGGRLIIKLDTEIKSERLEKNNLILIGGPVSNIISYEINNYLEIKFFWDKSWYISFNDKNYFDDEICLICKINNPFDKFKKIILIAGIRFTGTRAGIIALTNFHDEILENYKGSNYYCILKGFDKDGDGIEDDIKVIHLKY